MLGNASVSLSSRIAARSFVIIGAVVAVTASLARLQTQHDAAAQRRILQTLQASATPNPAPPEADRTTFVQHLNAGPSVDRVLSTLQSASKGLDVKVGSINVQRHPPTLQTLGRDDVSVTLRGRYASLKQVLSETMDRHHDLVLQHLALPSTSAAAEQEMQLSLTLLSSPAAASPAP